MSFMDTILRVEAERWDEATAAIAAGWTPDQHPATCCPALPPDPPKEAKTAQQRREWCNVRAVNAEYRAERLRRITTKLQAQIDSERGPDFGEINIPMRKRTKDLDAAITRGNQLAISLRQADHWDGRATYWRNRANNITEDS